MNVDVDGVVVEPIEDGRHGFHGSLGAVLQEIAPLVTPLQGSTAEEQMQRLCAAINATLDVLEEVTGMADARLLPELVERVTQLAVTGDNVEVQIGVTGDLRVDKRHRLLVDEVLDSVSRTPPSVRPAALRHGTLALRRLLALLLLHGWAGDAGTDPEACRAARQAIAGVLA